MTKKERALLREAIAEIHCDGGDYLRGMRILCKLAGYGYPMGEAVDNLKSLPVVDALRALAEAEGDDI